MEKMEEIINFKIGRKNLTLKFELFGKSSWRFSLPSMNNWVILSGYIQGGRIGDDGSHASVSLFKDQLLEIAESKIKAFKRMEKKSNRENHV